MGIKAFKKIEAGLNEVLSIVRSSRMMLELTADEASLLHKAALQTNMSLRRFIIDAAEERARQILSKPRLVHYWCGCAEPRAATDRKCANCDGSIPS